MKYYSGDINPGDNVVFVFGSNPEGRHGAGAAKVARLSFGAVYGQGEGLQGNSYALPTKDLRVKENRGYRSISPEDITENIRRLYGCARQNPDRDFCIAYRNTAERSLNGYTGLEMIRMFLDAGPVPDNIVVSEEWYRTGLFVEQPRETELLNTENSQKQHIMAENQNNVTPSWGRYARDGYEVSSEGDKHYSALYARFNEGTMLGNIDISGRTIEDVYQNVIKRSGKNRPPAEDSIVHNPDLTRKEDMEDYSYENGYLPLWTMWAQQHQAEMALLKARTDGGRITLTDKFATTRVSQARALADILAGNGALYSQEEIDRWFMQEERRLNPAKLEGYDLYSVGTGKESAAEFWEKVPSDATVIVDVRSYRRNSYYPHFDGKALADDVARHGIRYVWSRNLSGKASNGSVVKTDGKTKVYDYGREARTEGFATDLEWIQSLVAEGEKVVLVGGEGDPAYGARALLVGQELERSTNLHIGHIDHLHNGDVRVRSQEAVVDAAIGRGYRILKGDYRGLTFRSDRTYDAAPGTKVSFASVDGPEGGRRIEGKWNYATPVTFLEDDGYGEDRKGTKAATLMSSALLKNATETDYSLVFTFNGLDRDTSAAVDASAYHNMKLSLPEHKEDYYDEARIERTASRISRQIGRYLTNQYVKNGLKYVDTDHLKLNVEGAHIARISNEFVFDPALDGLTAAERTHLANTGLKMDDITAINQEDVNHYITAVLRAVTSSRSEFKVSEEEDDRVFKIEEIRTTGQSGVAEAATVASQALGLKTTVLAPKGFRHVIDNETVSGRQVADRASFENRFHQGLHNDVTLRNLQEQIDELDYRRMVREDGMQAGLTDRQVLALYNMGFNNTDIIDIVEIAAANATGVNSPSDMEDLLERCGGYGLPTAGITLEDITAAFELAARQQEQWKKDGITFVSTMSPYYPENLLQFKETPKTEYRTVETVGPDGTASFSVEPYTVTEKRPALLWLKGDISLLQEPSVSIDGNIATSKSGMDTARYVGSVFAQENMPAVITLDEGANMAIADEITSRGGRVIAVLPDGIKTSENDPQVRLEKIGERVGEITEALEQFPPEDEREALLKERDELYGEATALARKSPARRDAEARVTAKDGLLVSTSAPDSEVRDKENRSLAAKVAAGMGYACSFLDDVARAQPMNPIVMAAYAVYGMYYISYKGISKMAIGADGSLTKEEAPAAERETSKDTLAREDIESVIRDAEAHFETGPAPAVEMEQTEELEEGMAETRAVGRERFASRMNSFFEKFFDVPAKAPAPVPAVAREEEEVVLTPRRLPITVIHSTVPQPGYTDIYVVPEGHPEVNEAIARRYGPSVRFIIPEEERSVREQIAHRTIFYRDMPINRTADYVGTQPLHPETYTTTVYFEDGAVKTALEMPNGADGLINMAQRRENAEAMKEFTARCREMQLEFQKMTGYRTEKTADDDFLQFRYENADYLVTRPDCVEIRRGDEMRARVALTSTGAIKVENFVIASDDFQEYHETPTYKVFSNPPANPSREQLLSLVDEIRHTLETRGLVSQINDSVMTREEQDERNEKLGNNFLREREDNLTIAMNDFANGQRLGLIPEEADAKAVSRLEVYASASYTMKGILRDEKSVEKNIRETEKKIKAAETAKDDTLRAIPDAKYEKDKAALKAQAKDLLAEIDELVESRAHLIMRQGEVLRRKADVQDTLALLHQGAPFMCLKGDRKSFTVEIAGVDVALRTKKFSEEELQAAREALVEEPAETAEKEMDAPKENAAIPQPSEMTAEEIEKEMSAHGEWLHNNGEEGQEALSRMERIRQLTEEKNARESESVNNGQEASVEEAPAYKIVSGYQNDVCIVETDRGQAYADRQMNIISDSYPELRPMARLFGAACNENGEFKLINPDGSEVMDRWAKSFRVLGNGMILTTFPDGLNIYDIKNRTFVCENDLRQVNAFDEGGLAIITDKAGKKNYLKADGGLLLQTWCDAVSVFEDGKAVAVVGQNAYQIDRKGTILKATQKEEITPSNGTGGPK